MSPTFLNSLMNQGTGEELPFEFFEHLYMVGNSFLIGIILSFITYWVYSHSLKKTSHDYYSKRSKLILGASNLLYLTLGLTFVMILVNNNLARAFSIGAAIALVRFRIKLGQKSSASHILFSIIAGMACGLNEVSLAWLLCAIYSLISLVIFRLTAFSKTKIDASQIES
jgi:hypothetical protein